MWRELLGEPPAVAAWARKPTPLQPLLQQLAGQGLMAGHRVNLAAAEELAHTLELPPAGHGNYAAALLMLSAEAERGHRDAGAPGEGAAAAAEPRGLPQQGQLFLRQAVAAVKAAGGSASLGCTGRLLHKLRACWQVG